MYDSTLVAGCLRSREAFNRVAPFVAAEELSPQAAIWWPLVVEWYTADPQASAVDVPILRSRAERRIPPAHRETLLGWYDDLPPVASPINAVAALLDLKRFNAQQEHMAAFASGNAADARATWERYAALSEAASLEPQAEQLFYDPADAYRTTRPDALITLAPPGLQRRVGGLAPGDSVVVFARPEVGKTLFVVQLACKAARDGHRVLYLGNEEPLSRTVKRAVSCLTGKTNAEIEPRWEAALAAVRKGGLDNVIFHHLEPGTLAEVERCVRVAKPALVIIDQIRNITAEGDSSTVRMEDVQKAVRSMAAKYSFAAVSVTQAGNTAENKLFLDMADVDSSKTGIPGACDLMIGLGMEEGDKDRPKRGISLPKNKLGHTHEGFVVSFHQHKTQITGDN